jgi:ligand-binding sensor domain-containing protein
VWRNEGFLSRGAYKILEDRKGNLWFTTEKDGVWRYDGKSFKNFTEKDGLVNNAVLSILEDNDGNIWFGTKWLGLSRYDGENFITFAESGNQD